MSGNYEALVEEYRKEMISEWQRRTGHYGGVARDGYGEPEPDRLTVKLSALQELSPALAGAIAPEVDDLRRQMERLSDEVMDLRQTIEAAEDFGRWLTRKYDRARVLWNEDTRQRNQAEETLRKIAEAKRGTPMRQLAADYLNPPS